MRKFILCMATTLDGVVAPEGEATEVFDLEDDGVWSHHFKMLETVDAVVLGAGMHREYLSHWQAALTAPAGPNEGRYAALAARIPHFVLSRTLRKVEWPNATVLHGGVDRIADLKQQPGGDIVMWGGPTAAAAAIEAGMVDAYSLVTHPVVAGRGKKLFGNVVGKRRLHHEKTTTLPSGIVILEYGSR